MRIAGLHLRVSDQKQAHVLAKNNRTCIYLYACELSSNVEKTRFLYGCYDHALNIDHKRRLFDFLITVNPHTRTVSFLHYYLIRIHTNMQVRLFLANTCACFWSLRANVARLSSLVASQFIGTILYGN